MDAPRRDMELLSNSLAAYAHIRGEPAPLACPQLPASPPRLPGCSSGLVILFREVTA